MSARPDNRGPRRGHDCGVDYVQLLMSADQTVAVTMYTTTWCGYCVRLKKVLRVIDLAHARDVPVEDGLGVK